MIKSGLCNRSSITSLTRFKSVALLCLPSRHGGTMLSKPNCLIYCELNPHHEPYCINRVKYAVFLITTFAFFIVSCKNEESKQQIDTLNQVHSYFAKYDIEKSPYIIVLPNQGCMGCITVAENFLAKNVKDTRCTFILTSILSPKVLKSKLGNTIITSPNVYLDNENYLGSRIKQLIYPIVIIQENGKENTIYYQKPGESAFRILENILNKK